MEKTVLSFNTVDRSQGLVLALNLGSSSPLRGKQRSQLATLIEPDRTSAWTAVIGDSQKSLSGPDTSDLVERMKHKLTDQQILL